MQEFEEKTLAHYSIQHRLARGGMSNIYLAYDERTQRPVAIKVVHRSEDDYFKRFQLEVKTLSRLTHEHILPIIDSGEAGSWHYCIMPYIEQGTLRERLAKGALSQEEAGSILEQIAAALQFAHDHGILHRDIKPSNILLRDGHHAYLADFGLVKDTKSTSSITQSGNLLGTPEYMAPELAEEPATTSSDIYSVGILLYQMLTGQVPFKGSYPLSIYLKHINEQPAPPSLLNSAISYPVEQVILRALQKEPRRRFKTVQAMAQAYTQALQTAEQLKMVQLQDAHSLTNGITLPAPTQRVIPLSAATGSSRRQVHPVITALIAALFLFVMPLSIGFAMYQNGLSLKAPIMSGANAQFAKINGTLHRTPPTQKPVSSGVQPYGQQSDGPGQQSSGQSNQSNRHGHRHKHGHSHESDDNYVD